MNKEKLIELQNLLEELYDEEKLDSRVLDIRNVIAHVEYYLGVFSSEEEYEKAIGLK